MQTPIPPSGLARWFRNMKARLYGPDEYDVRSIASAILHQYGRPSGSIRFIRRTRMESRLSHEDGAMRITYTYERHTGQWYGKYSYDCDRLVRTGAFCLSVDGVVDVQWQAT